MNNLTPVEQKIFEAWKREIPGIQIDTHIDLIRKRTKETAYHEAGHAAANAFTGLNHSHFERLTIIPSQEYLGRFSQSRICEIVFFRQTGWLTIIGHLGGRMAQKRVDDDDFEPVVNDDFDLNTDEERALKVAEQISKRGWPPFRILNMVEDWTDEILNIPIVWNVVEKLAQRLLEVGEITDFDEYDNFVNPIRDLWRKIPKWKRRFRAKQEQIAGGDPG